MKTNVVITEFLIAPCGMDCGLCAAYQREKKPCRGCHAGEENKSASCINCSIRNCEYLKLTDSGLCVDCDNFPCARVRHIDKRYRIRYGMSMIENLQTIQSIGLQAFVKSEQERWACPNCGGILSVHRGNCLLCGATKPAVEE
ncbi:MAG TPA: DUF3795 domain-containing protein [Anaerolineales bacterium]|nr:DUF3795 domain-containing protein [Anaerolineales bacterium]HNN12984.1 DUF3795 domain-containing protein [Anaerolineales bacterium]HNO30359.1 DUF3795 domain-containing protein [Anaerolineales bacterium]